MKLTSRRIFAMMLLFVTITGMVMSFSENVLCAGDLPRAHETLNSPHEHDTQQDHKNSCPCAPSPSNSPSDHFCAGNCGCPCQAPLSSTPVTFAYSPAFTYLYATEITRHIPEVYLSLFVPPDSAAV